MKALVFMSLFLITTSSCYVDGVRRNQVESFIKSSNKTVSIISIDEKIDENFILKELKAIILFEVKSESLVGCEEVCKADKYSNVTISSPLDVFRKTKSFKDFMELDSDYDTVIFSSSLFLDFVLKCFINPLGSFFIFLTDNVRTFTDEDLKNKLNKTWRDNGAFNVYVSIHEIVYSFDPFHPNFNGIPGRLNSHSNPCARHKLTNLNGYSLNVEMFAATFTVSSVKNPKSVDDFSGPDANAAKFVRECLNATS